MAKNYSVKLDGQNATYNGSSGDSVKNYEDFIAALTGCDDPDCECKDQADQYGEADFQDDMLQAVINLCAANARLSALIERMFDEA